MEDSLSITKDIGEYYIYLKDNSNLIAKGYEKFWLRRWPLKPQKGIWMSGIYQWKVFTKYGQSWFKVQFKISVMKRKFENQKHKA